MKMYCFIIDIQYVSLVGPFVEKLEGIDEECGGQQEGNKQLNSRSEGNYEP